MRCSLERYEVGSDHGSADAHGLLARFAAQDASIGVLLRTAEGDFVDDGDRQAQAVALAILSHKTDAVLRGMMRIAGHLYTMQRGATLVMRHRANDGTQEPRPPAAYESS